jgi:SNF2 family DNA or RNA helicase
VATFAPHPYQKRGISFLVQHPEAALFHEPGLGKTAVTLTAMQALMKVGGVRKALVIAPLRVAYQVWSEVGELGKWDQFAGLRVSLLHGDHKERALAQDADVYVINFDGLLWLTESPTPGVPARLDGLIKRGVDLLVVDELSKLKHPQTRRFKAIKPWLGRFRRRWGLTGTPVANGLLDLFGQCYVLDLGRALGRFITHFRNRYFIPTGYGGYTWAPRPGAERDIFTALAPLASSLKAADCLDLPELVERDVWVELPEAARKVYTALEDDLIAVVNSTTVTAANTAVALNKCRQVVGGALYHQADGAADRTWLPVHDAKVEAVVEIVDELQGAPALIAYAFDHELIRLRAALGAKTPALCGGVSSKDAAATIAAWNAGEVPVLLAHPAAAGHGLNLQGSGGAHVIFFTLPWDLEEYLQLIARIWRQGSAAPRVIVQRVLARETVDLAVRTSLARKARGQAALFAALRRPAWR